MAGNLGAGERYRPLSHAIGTQRVLEHQLVSHGRRALTVGPDGRTVRGNIGCEGGDDSITRALSDGANFVQKGRYLTVWRREPNGSWHIVADKQMADPA